MEHFGPVYGLIFEQNCTMIFGSWTYDMASVNVKGFNFGGEGDTTITIGSDDHNVFNGEQKVS